MNVTLTHPISNFTGNVNFQDGAAILGFTAGTCSVDLDPKFFNAVSAYGITITIGTPGPAPAYDANYDVVTAAIVGAPGSQTTGALKAAFVALAPAPSGGDDTTMLQTFLNGLSANSVVYWPRGDYLIPTGVTLSVPATHRGCGSGDFTTAAGTRFICSSATADALTLSANGISLQDLAVVNTSGTTPTAGSGIHMTTGDNDHFARVKVVGFYNNVDIQQGRYYTWTDCLLLDAVNWHVRVRNTVNYDFGDCGWHGCTFAAFNTNRVCAAGIRWESGGGFRFENNKTNGNYAFSGNSMVRALDIAPSDGGTTSVFVITGNSLEGCNTDAIMVRETTLSGGTGFISKMVIVGNEMYGGGIRIDSTHLNTVVISGNVFSSPSADSIYILSADTISIGHNSHTGLGAGFAAVHLDTFAENVDIAPQSVKGTGVVLFQDTTQILAGGAGSTHRVRGHGELTYAREVPITTSTSTYVTLFTIDNIAFYGYLLELVIAGQVTAKGSSIIRQMRAVTDAGPATLPTATLVGTDAVVGNAFDVLFDTTTNNKVIVKMRLNSTAGGTDVVGKVGLKITGPFAKITRA